MWTGDDGTVKRCTRCGREKPLEQYGKHKHGAGGRHARCKVCRAAEKRANYKPKATTRLCAMCGVTVSTVNNPKYCATCRPIAERARIQAKTERAKQRAGTKRGMGDQTTSLPVAIRPARVRRTPLSLAPLTKARCQLGWWRYVSGEHAQGCSERAATGSVFCTEHRVEALMRVPALRQMAEAAA